MISINAKKFIINTLAVTLCTLYYVHQNIEIIKMGYDIDINQKKHAYYFDQHKRLVYNLSKLKSPIFLNQRLHAESIDLIGFDTDKVYYASIKEKTKGASSIPSYDKKTRVMTKILDIFTEKAEAGVR